MIGLKICKNKYVKNFSLYLLIVIGMMCVLLLVGLFSSAGAKDYLNNIDWYFFGPLILILVLMTSLCIIISIGCFKKIKTDRKNIYLFAFMLGVIIFSIANLFLLTIRDSQNNQSMRQFERKQQLENYTAVYHGYNTYKTCLDEMKDNNISKHSTAYLSLKVDCLKQKMYLGIYVGNISLSYFKLSNFQRKNLHKLNNMCEDNNLYSIKALEANGISSIMKTMKHQIINV